MRAEAPLTARRHVFYVSGYDLLRQEHFIRANMAEPLPRQIHRALGWAIDYLLSGALLRVLRASAYFGLVLIYFQLMLIAWIALSAGAAWILAAAITRGFALPGCAELVIGVPAAIAIFLGLRRLPDRWLPP